MNPDPKSRLAALLKAWQPEADLPPRLESGVWRRIAAVHEKRSSLWSFDWLFSLTYQPKFAFALIVTALLLGTGLANWQAGQTYHREMAVSQSHYIRSVDPFANTLLSSNP